MRPRHLYREPGDQIGAYVPPKLATRPRPRVVTLARLILEAATLAAFFFALGFALVVAGALINPTYGV